MTFFAGFDERRVDVGDGVVLRVRSGGSGPPVVLLHGHPRTHTTWHRVAPLLVAAGHTVVCPDLRGYGQSTQAADVRGPRAVLQAGDGRRRRHADAAARPRPVRRRRARPGQLRRRCGWPWTTRPRSRTWPSSTACRSSRRSTGPTPASPPPGGTGSSSRSPTSPSGRSTPTPRPGTARCAPAGRRRWGRRTTPTHLRAIHDPDDGARDARGLPRRARRRPGRRGGRPRRRPAGQLPDAGAVVRRDDLEDLHGDPLAIWAGLDDRPARRRDRSTAATTWPRRHPRSWPPRWSPSWRCDHVRSPGYGGDPTREERPCRRRRRPDSPSRTSCPARCSARRRRRSGRSRRRTTPPPTSTARAKRANQVAWAAVKHAYEKVGDHWEKKDGG